MSELSNIVQQKYKTLELIQSLRSEEKYWRTGAPVQSRLAGCAADELEEQQSTIARQIELLNRINKKLFGYVDSVWNCPVCECKKLLQDELYKAYRLHPQDTNYDKQSN
jgi:hypothetical protein